MGEQHECCFTNSIRHKNLFVERICWNGALELQPKLKRIEVWIEFAFKRSREVELKYDGYVQKYMTWVFRGKRNQLKRWYDLQDKIKWMFEYKFESLKFVRFKGRN